jgi:hypothetical protein
MKPLFVVKYSGNLVSGEETALHDTQLWENDKFRKLWSDTQETLLGEYWILYPCRTTPAPQLLENGESRKPWSQKLKQHANNNKE